MQQKNWTLRFKDEEYNAWYVTEATTAREILAFLSKKDCTFGLDTETQGAPGFRYHGSDAALCPHRGQLRTIQISDGKNTVVFDCNTLLPECRPELLAFLGAKRFIAHNALFDLQFLMRLGVRRLNVGCTFIATKLLYHAIHADDSPYRASLDAMVYSLLGEDVSKHMQVSDWSVPDLTFEQVEYAALDPVLCLLISEKLSKGIQKHGLQRIYNLYKEAQLPLAQMQLNGMKFDVETHRDLVGQWTLDAFAAKKEVLKLTGLSDLTASKIAKYLEENLDPGTLRIWPLTESKKLSTDSHTLQDFAHLPIVKPFSKFQKASTLCSTFGAKLAQKLNPKTGRLHTQFKLCGARTGRLSSAAPNLQNAPRDESFRKLFIPEKGNKLVLADFGQIELRVAAELSQDKTMLQAYREGIDLHALTASKVSKKKLEEVTKAERQLAKAINFGLLFGLGKQKFSKYARQSYGVDVTEAEAEEAIETFRSLYSGYREWQLLQASNAETSLSCTTPFGKKRRLAEGDTYGTSMNQPVQGGAAEVMFSSLIAFTKNATDEMRLINVVHDEIIVECPMNIAEATKEVLERSMTEGFLAVFPNGITNKLVEAKVVDNWAEKK